MKPIQYLLALLVAGGMLLYFARLRSRLADRAIVLLLGAAGLVLVAFPDLANRLAALLGVWRGADLVIYIALLGLAWVCLVLLSRLRELDARLTELARAMALLAAQPPHSLSQAADSAVVGCQPSPQAQAAQPGRAAPEGGTQS